MPVHTSVTPCGTHPEPAVLIVFYGLQEVLTHLQTNKCELATVKQTKSCIIIGIS